MHMADIITLYLIDYTLIEIRSQFKGKALQSLLLTGI